MNISIDTVIGIAGCLLSIIGIILGGKAYKQCQIMKDSMNDKKEFGDNCNDYSQKANGDIINGVQGEELCTMMSNNFGAALQVAYDNFRKINEENIKSILKKTEKIIEENKLQIGHYTKIDWIQVYLESAKNTSDQYMQDVWARVLAKELSEPDSFSYKTLDVLKNMSADDFKMFEKLANCEINGFILSKPGFYDNNGLKYIDYLRLGEQGLLNTTESQRKFTINNRNSINIVCGDKLIVIGNPTDDDVSIEINGYLLTNVAEELQSILYKEYDLDRIKRFMNELHDRKKESKITLHQIINVNNGKVDFKLEDIYSVD